MASGCPRNDLIGSIPCRESVRKLPKYYTFDHTFHQLRRQDKYWFLKTKPIRGTAKTEFEEHMSLINIMRVSSEQIRALIEYKHRFVLLEAAYDTKKCLHTARRDRTAEQKIVVSADYRGQSLRKASKRRNLKLKTSKLWPQRSRNRRRSQKNSLRKM